MTAQYLYSSAKRNAALAAIGGDAIGQIEVDLLKQVLVATVASGGGGGGAAAWGSITGTLSAQTDLQTALDAKLNLTGGTMTGQLILQNASATGAVNVSPTWNNAGTNFAGIYGRVTNTASGASSKLIDIGTVAGGSLFSVAVNGNARITSTDSVGECLTLTSIYGTHTLAVGGGGSLSLSNDVYVRGNIFGAYDSSRIILGISGDLRLCRAAAATLQLGDNHATTPTAQTFKAHDVTTGTGSSLTVESGVGSVANGVVNICKDYNSPLGFFNSRSATQASTLITGATQNTGVGAQVFSDDTFDGYTLAQVVAAVRSYGLLA